MKEPRFAELYVVSDLHLGDTRGQPIFNQTAALAGLIRHVAEREGSASAPVGMVLNGDVFDTLPEPMEGYVCNRDEAEGVIQSILESSAFSAIFLALRTLCARPGHRLIFVLGNHDLELIYANVQELLIEYLIKDESSAAPADRAKAEAEQEARRARITFATAGTGFRCRVGAAAQGAVSVACVHGNEFDDWNAFDPEMLTRLARAGTLGRESELTRSAPNSGTRLVRDVMNGIKAKYPFVDLLKPEQEGVFTILLAIAPDELRRVPGFLKTVVSSATVGAIRVARVLGAGDGSLDAATPVVDAAEPPGKWQPTGAFARFLEQPQPNASNLLAGAWQQTLSGDTRPEELAQADEVLGKGRLALNLLDYYVRRIVQSPSEALRAALKDWGGSPETWSLDGECPVFDALAKIEPDADVLVAGHTHLRRQKRLPASGKLRREPLYLNTGTWIRLLRLQSSTLEPGAFEPLLAALKSKSMASLDALGGGILLEEKTVAVIRPAADGSMAAAICEFNAAPGQAEPLTAVSAWEKL